MGCGCKLLTYLFRAATVYPVLPVTIKSTGASLNDETDRSCPDGNRRKKRIKEGRGTEQSDRKNK